MTIKPTYIVDEQFKKVAVQIDIKTFEKIQQLLEDHLLVKIMKEREKEDEFMKVEDAQAYYQRSKKTKKVAGSSRKKVL